MDFAEGFSRNMSNTGQVQLNMWTFAESQAEAARDGADTSASPTWMSWSADFPVRTLVLPGNVRVFEKAHALVFGSSSYDLLASYDPALCCWKMSPGLPTKTLKRLGYYDKRMRCWLLVRCPKSAMTQNGKLYLLPMPERPTQETDGSAWATPTAHDFQNRLAPTNDKIHVTSSGTLKYINQTGLSNIRLSQSVKYYEEKENWHTLVANDGLKEGAIEQKRENGLAAQVQWATPCARDSRTGGYAADKSRHTPNLNTQAIDNPGDKLNPDWCEQLMGFPIGWTDPDVTVPRMTAAELMCHEFPAPPGPQLPHEAPRTTGRKEYRKDRIKALGNGVVPQDVLPIALAIKDYLEREDGKEN
jgi:hypothetical protein